jgi:haloalkane dehalogenase
MQVLRTPDERFAAVRDFAYPPNYVDVAAGVDGGLRMAWVESGSGDPILCVHGEPSWGYLYRKMISPLTAVGRVVVPDLIGFGRSDKPAAKDDYTYALHHDALASFILQLDLKRITLVCQDWGGLLGLPIAAEMPERFARLVIMNTGLPVSGKPFSAGFMAWRNFAEKSTDIDVGRVIERGTTNPMPPEVIAAYNAPFPDVSYKAGALKFPLLVPISPDAEALPHMRKAADALRSWDKPAIVLFSDLDPVTSGGDKFFRDLILTTRAEPSITIEGAGHFLQEDSGEIIARHIVDFIRRRPVP